MLQINIIQTFLLLATAVPSSIYIFSEIAQSHSKRTKTINIVFYSLSTILLFIFWISLSYITGSWPYSPDPQTLADLRDYDIYFMLSITMLGVWALSFYLSNLPGKIGTFFEYLWLIMLLITPLSMSGCMSEAVKLY